MSKWIKVSQQEFKQFNKDNFCMAINHRNGFKFFGNSTIGLSKKKIDNSEFYINSKYIKTYQYKVEVIENGDCESFIITENYKGINEVFACEKLRKELKSLNYNLVSFVEIKQV